MNNQEINQIKGILALKEDYKERLSYAHERLAEIIEEGKFGKNNDEYQRLVSARDIFSSVINDLEELLK